MSRNNVDRPIYSLTNIAKTYVLEEGPVISIPALEIPRGQVVALIGYSGSGKTTLLNLLAMLETPDDLVRGAQERPSLKFTADPDAQTEEVLNFSDRRRQELRATFGFVFQQGYLLENLTCGDNIKVPFYVRKLQSSGSGIVDMMQTVGLPEAMSERQPSEVSGGERQRVSVLRALAHGPSVVFADEPTSNLDEDNALMVLSGLLSWHRGGLDRTVMLVTHNIGHAAKYADSIVMMAPGRVCGPVPNFAPGTGLRMTAAELSGKLADFSEERRSTDSHSAKPILDGPIIQAPRLAANPVATLCRFVFSFALADVFPRVSPKARKGVFQKVFKRRNAQFHSMASMFFALLLALFFASLYSSLSTQFRKLVEDRSIARIEVLGRRDGERLLSHKDVDELAGLSWVKGQSVSQISTPGETRAKQLSRVRPAVEAAVGYRLREMRFARNSSLTGFSFATETNLSVVSTRTSDPILQKIELMKGSRIDSMLPDEKAEKSLGSQFTASPDIKLGVVCTKAALLQLGFTGAPPKTVELHPPYSTSGVSIAVPLVGVVEWLPKSADVLITDELFEKFFFQGGSGDPLPRFEAVDVYFEDMMKDGIALYEALQRLGYSVSADRLSFLKWVVVLMRAVQYFSLVAGAGVFLVVLISLMVSYSEAIRRKEKEIGVLLAYGTPMRILYSVFMVEVGFVWAVAVLLAIPSQWAIAKAVQGLVAEGFKLQGSQAAVSSLPFGVWGIILGGSLAVAVISVSFTMRKIDPNRVAQTLRSPD